MWSGVDNHIKTLTPIIMEENLFDLQEIDEYEKHWQGMPEFHQKDAEPFRQIIVSFESIDDIRKFAELMEQNITHLTKSMWFPKVDNDVTVDRRWLDEGANI